MNRISANRSLHSECGLFLFLVSGVSVDVCRGAQAGMAQLPRLVEALNAGNHIARKIFVDEYCLGPLSTFVRIVPYNKALPELPGAGFPSDQLAYASH